MRLRADGLDTRLLDAVEEGAGLGPLRGEAAMHGGIMAGELQGHEIGVAAQNATSAAEGRRGGSGRRAFSAPNRARPVGGVDDLDLGALAKGAHAARDRLLQGFGRGGLRLAGLAVRQNGHAFNISASSPRSRAGESTGTGGFVSPVPGPYSSGRATCAVFSPQRGGGLEIGRMRRDHHAGGRVEIEGASRDEIGLGMRLIVRAISAPSTVSQEKRLWRGEIDHDRDIAVRYRREAKLGCSRACLGGTSGQASSLCRCGSAPRGPRPESPRSPKRGMRSRFSPCSTSRST